jgi:hypothetical protein
MTTFNKSTAVAIAMALGLAPAVAAGQDRILDPTGRLVPRDITIVFVPAALLPVGNTLDQELLVKRPGLAPALPGTRRVYDAVPPAICAAAIPCL